MSIAAYRIYLIRSSRFHHRSSTGDQCETMSAVLGMALSSDKLFPYIFLCSVGAKRYVLGSIMVDFFFCVGHFDSVLHRLEIVVRRRCVYIQLSSSSSRQSVGKRHHVQSPGSPNGGPGP